MGSEHRNRYLPSEVSPPGETLREIIEERGLSQSHLANRMGRPVKTINEIINGKAAITPETALELALVLGIEADFWNARERDYRACLAKHEQEERLKKLISWARLFPLQEMEKHGWLPRTSDPGATVRSLLEFLGVASTEQWKEQFKSYRVAFRTPAHFQVNEHSLSAWLRAGISIAEREQARPYDRETFLQALRIVRPLSIEPPEKFQPELTRRCVSAGVVVAFVPELSRSRASGATMWPSGDRALIQLSLRYKTDDHLWFTFFHEAAHVLLHRKREIFLETGAAKGAEEEEANQWAADFLIPPRDYQELTGRTRFSKAFIRDFAGRIGIAPGIVVGRLQHDGLLPHTHCNELKRRLAWCRADQDTSREGAGRPE